IVDQFGKVTVSLGGVCTLGCRHCYTMTSQFKHAAVATGAQVVAELKRLDGFSLICVSGDTDCFLEEDAGVDLLERIVQEFGTSTDLMFTTRMVPSASARRRIVNLADIARASGKLLIPCVSLVSYSYPNAVERAARVPSSLDRIAL